MAQMGNTECHCPLSHPLESWGGLNRAWWIFFFILKINQVAQGFFPLKKAYFFFRGKIFQHPEMMLTL